MLWLFSRSKNKKARISELFCCLSVLNNDKNVQLIDVRTPGEWADGIIDNAIKINVTADDFEKLALEKLDKSNPVYIYCRSGGRSKIAADVLLKNGFQPYNVLGGYMAWEEKNK